MLWDDLQLWELGRILDVLHFAIPYRAADIVSPRGIECLVTGVLRSALNVAVWRARLSHVRQSKIGNAVSLTQSGVLRKRA